MNINRIISFFLHPILFPLIGSIIYLLVVPKFISYKSQLVILSVVFIGTYLLPILLLFLLKRLKLIQSFQLHTIEERKFPFLLFTFLAVLIGKMLFKTELVNDLAIYFIAGGLALLIVYGFLWLSVKVSIHTLGIGGLIGFVINISMIYHQNLLLVLAVLFLLFGVIANARVKLRAHSFSEVIWGVLIGISTQLFIPMIY